MKAASAHLRARVLYRGRHLSLRKKGSWEFVERRGRAEGVMIVAVTSQRKLLLVEELRPPVGRSVISLPAGLVGDEGKREKPKEAARRELREETGHEAAALEYLGTGPTSPGLASEIVSFFRARGVRRVGAPSLEEGIRLHAVPLRSVREWTRKRSRNGALVHPLLWAGLYLARL